MKNYAYCRVSDVCQNENRQLDAVAKLNIPHAQVFVDSPLNAQKGAEKMVLRKEKATHHKVSNCSGQKKS